MNTFKKVAWTIGGLVGAFAVLTLAEGYWRGATLEEAEMMAFIRANVVRLTASFAIVGIGLISLVVWAVVAGVTKLKRRGGRIHTAHSL